MTFSYYIQHKFFFGKINIRVKPMFMIFSIENEDTSGNFIHLAYNSSMNYEQAKLYGTISQFVKDRNTGKFFRPFWANHKVYLNDGVIINLENGHVTIIKKKIPFFIGIRTGKAKINIYLNSKSE